MFENILVLYGYENVDDGCSNSKVDRDRLERGGRVRAERDRAAESMEIPAYSQSENR